MVSRRESDPLELNGRMVHAFSLEMNNLGFQRMADKIRSMLESGAWRRYVDGLGEVELLPGEFDYFLSMCHVTRDMVMTGIRDVAAKAKLQLAMDERRAGEDGYRRHYEDVRVAMGARRRAEPFGYTQAEAKSLAKADAGLVTSKYRPALGESIRRYITTGSTIRPSKPRTRVERLEASIARLADEELAELLEWVSNHQKQRGQKPEP